jgi:hypothetical protein
VSTSQTQVTSLVGLIIWFMGALFHGDGFADAFNSSAFANPRVPDEPVVTSVIVLTATQPGILGWDCSD